MPQREIARIGAVFALEQPRYASFVSRVTSTYNHSIAPKAVSEVFESFKENLVADKR